MQIALARRARRSAARSIIVGRTGGDARAGDLGAVPGGCDNHQFSTPRLLKKRARLYARAGERVAGSIAAKAVELIRNESVREKMRAALAGWHAPRAAEEIAESIHAGDSRAFNDWMASKAGIGASR